MDGGRLLVGCRHARRDRARDDRGGKGAAGGRPPIPAAGCLGRRPMARRVIVTGSTGNLGAKAVTALRKLGGFEIVRVGRNAGNEPDVIVADLARYDTGWARHFAGAEAVLHLAADPKPVADWPTVVPLNIDLSLNLFRAAEEGGVGRIIFASSNWVLGGYRFREDRLSDSLPPRPV